MSDTYTGTSSIVYSHSATSGTATANSLISRTVLTVDNLSFSSGGVNYRAHGEYIEAYDGALPVSGGEVVLWRNGVRAARLTMSATRVLTVEMGGESRPLY